MLLLGGGWCGRWLWRLVPVVAPSVVVGVRPTQTLLSYHCVSGFGVLGWPRRRSAQKLLCNPGDQSRLSVAGHQGWLPLAVSCCHPHSVSIARDPGCWLLLCVCAFLPVPSLRPPVEVLRYFVGPPRNPIPPVPRQRHEMQSLTLSRPAGVVRQHPESHHQVLLDNLSPSRQMATFAAAYRSRCRPAPAPDGLPWGLAPSGPCRDRTVGN